MSDAVATSIRSVQHDSAFEVLTIADRHDLDQSTLLFIFIIVDFSLFVHILLQFALFSIRRQPSICHWRVSSTGGRPASACNFRGAAQPSGPSHRLIRWRDRVSATGPSCITCQSRARHAPCTIQGALDRGARGPLEYSCRTTTRACCLTGPMCRFLKMGRHFDQHSCYNHQRASSTTNRSAISSTVLQV